MKKFFEVSRSIPKLFVAFLFATLGVNAVAASVPACNLENMRPYIRSGLREYAAETLYVNNIKTFPKNVTVTYVGVIPFSDGDGVRLEDGFEVSALTDGGDQILVFTNLPGHPKWLAIPPPIVEKHIDQEGHVLGEKCVTYLGPTGQRVNYFENAKNGIVILKDILSQPPSMLAWMAIKNN